MGKLIVLEGLDGSGKATQAKLLTEALIEKGKKVMQITFPNYSSESSSLVKMYLNGDFGTQPSDVNAYAASSFYSVDRYASYKTGWADFYNSDGIVISDRYTTSNAVHQCSKLPKDEWDNYLNWLFTFEYDYIGIPKPEKVIFLDVEPSISQSLMTQRYNGSEMKKDIHEKNLEYLNSSYKSAQYCAEKYNWTHIKCSENGILKSINEIHKSILTHF